jgi:hypothetical protein
MKLTAGSFDNLLSMNFKIDIGCDALSHPPQLISFSLGGA